MTLQSATFYIYNLALLPMIFVSFLFLLLCLLNLLMSREKQKAERAFQAGTLPFVTVQIPTYNDPIAARCVERCLGFDYPQNKYEIVIADDSTNVATQCLLRGYVDAYPDRVKYVHRTNRTGFKAGALKEAMPLCNGELIVIFDSDWIPGEDFLKKVISPFSDPEVALVQTRQGFYNKDTNLITRFAAYLLMVYHTIFMPINNKINCVFFCGTAGALRRSTFEEVGGWNLNSITEDSDLSVRLLVKGYKSVYLDFSTPSEVPYTIEGFVKQQMRWCYGNTRVFFDHARSIIFGRGLSLRQRVMMCFITLGNMTAPIVFIMTFFGFAGWFVGDPMPFKWADVYTFIIRFLYTAGFLLMGLFALTKQRRLKEYPYFILASFTMGVVLSTVNSVAFLRAVADKKLHWYCTPKEENKGFV